MFVARKLAKLRKEGRKQTTRANREMQRNANNLPTPDRVKIQTAVQQLEEALAGANPGAIDNHTKNCKQLVDQIVPWWRTSLVTEYVEVIVVALALAFFIRSFFVQAFKIPSGSMIPTLRVGDHILVNKFLYGFSIPIVDKKIMSFTRPRRGDIIVFKFPQDPSKDYIKRVIGIPGDTIRVKDTSLFINGIEMPKKLEGSYRFEDPPNFEQTSDLFIETIDGKKHNILYDENAVRLGEIVKTVPPGQYFCMGDNRDRSNDGRYWGFVPFDNIKGKAMIIYFSWPPGQFTRIGKILR